jgi:hypothetical protein
MSSSEQTRWAKAKESDKTVMVRSSDELKVSANSNKHGSLKKNHVI